MLMLEKLTGCREFGLLSSATVNLLEILQRVFYTMYLGASGAISLHFWLQQRLK